MLFLILGFSLGAIMIWMYRVFFQTTPRHAFPLRQTIDPSDIDGVEQRFNTHCPKRGRRMLERLGTMPAILIQDRARWYVCTGKGLTVRPVSETHPRAIVVEFTLAGRPRIASNTIKPVVNEKSGEGEAGNNPSLLQLQSSSSSSPSSDNRLPLSPSLPQQEPNKNTGIGSNNAPLNLQQLSANSISMKSIADMTQIRFFPTLTEAAAAARVGPNENGVVEYIVGGSQQHPVYYVVPVLQSGSSESLQFDSENTQQIWVRR